MIKRLQSPHSLTYLLICLATLSQSAFANYQEGLDAYNAGNYKTAMYEWKQVASSPPGKVSPATYAEATYAIGMLYWHGQGAPADYLEASKWLHKAANLGHAGAQGKLGFLYTQGITVQQNYELAFDWFSKAAKQGDVDGQYNLGIFYLNGWGTEPNKTLAAQYLAAASVQGDKQAEKTLQALLPNIKDNTVIPAKVGTPPPKPSSKSPKIHPPTWILQQPPSHYTIQVIALRSRPDLDTLIATNPELAPFATYTQIKNNQIIHVLIQGNYATVEAARNAQARFPKHIQPPKNTWIRKFEKIQSLITSN